MSTPSLTPSPPPAGDPLTVPDRPAAKAGLLLLVLLMLGLLLWQMSQELRQQERFEHERAAAQLDRSSWQTSRVGSSPGRGIRPV